MWQCHTCVNSPWSSRPILQHANCVTPWQREVLTFGYFALWDVFVFNNKGGCAIVAPECVKNSVHWPQYFFHDNSSPIKVLQHYSWQKTTSPSCLIPLDHITSDHQVIKFRLQRHATAKLHFLLIQTYYPPCCSTHVKSKEN